MKGALALIALMSFGAQTQESTKLEWKPKAGESVNLEMKMSMTMPGAGDIDVSFILKNKTVKVEKDKVTTESEMSDFKLFFGGQEMDMGGQGPGEGQKATSVQKLNGEVISTDAPAEAGGGPRLDRMNAFYHPEKEIKMGESWEHEWAADKDKGLQAAKAKWTLSGHEVKNGVDCWKIDFVFAEMDTPDGMSRSGTTWVDVATSSLQYSTFQFNNVSYSPEMPPTSGTGSITRLK